jgi:hypothetical protein
MRFGKDKKVAVSGVISISGYVSQMMQIIADKFYANIYVDQRYLRDEI